MPSPFILLLAAHLSIGGFLPPLCMTRTLVRCLKFWTMWGSWWAWPSYWHWVSGLTTCESSASCLESFMTSKEENIVIS